MFRKRQNFFKNRLDINVNVIKKQLLTVKSNAGDIASAIDEINMGDNPLKELAVLEKQERASFAFVAENSAEIVRDLLLKIEFFEANRNFILKIMERYNKWSNL